MMSQQFHRPEPPNKVKTFMKDIGWPFIILTVGTALATVIATVIVTVWIGKTQILNFNWLILVLALALIVITASFAWYNVRTRKILQNKYQEEIAALRKEYTDYMAAYREYVNQEIIRWNEQEQVNAKEQKERLEAVRNEFLRAIANAKEELTAPIQNRLSNLDIWVTEHDNAHKWEQKSYKHQLEALEKKLTDKQLSESGN